MARRRSRSNDPSTRNRQLIGYSRGCTWRRLADIARSGIVRMYIDVPHTLTVRVVVEVGLREVVRFYRRWPKTHVSISEELDTKITG